MLMNMIVSDHVSLEVFGLLLFATTIISNRKKQMSINKNEFYCILWSSIVEKSLLRMLKKKMAKAIIGADKHITWDDGSLTH